jgi:hypothetical protein
MLCSLSIEDSLNSCQTPTEFMAKGSILEFTQVLAIPPLHAGSRCG